MKKILLTAAALLTMSATTGATAQVTIGSTANPQEFSILELISNGSRGMRLPQMTTAQRDEMVNSAGFQAEKSGKALGLEIFNKSTKCVETWNGTKWISACGDIEVSSPQTFCSGATVNNLAATGVNIKWYNAAGLVLTANTPLSAGTYYVTQTVNGTESEKIAVTVTRDPCVKIPTPTGCTTPVPPVIFMSFNLGADESLDTPKKQMKYLAEHSFSILDAHVYGGLFQWGRKWDKTNGDANSYPVSISGSYLRYTGNGSGGTTHSTSMSSFTLSDNYDTSGQPKTNIGDHLYSSSTNNYDWLKKDESSSLWNSTLGMAPGRWGNGNAVGYDGFSATDVGAVLYNGKYYQKPVKTVNDPCPAGFRVPTQDEWERLCDYNCNPGSAVGLFYTNNVKGTVPSATSNPGLTWVHVVCTYSDTEADRRCVPDATWSENVTSSGYAIYATVDWEDAITTGVYKDWDMTTNGFSSYPSLHSDAAPEPLLFLPAAGYRNLNSSTLEYTGSKVYYWSSAVNSTGAYHLYFTSSYVNPSSNSNRAYGSSIRCVAE
jgi:hypothetical protein